MHIRTDGPPEMWSLLGEGEFSEDVPLRDIEFV